MSKRPLTDEATAEDARIFTKDGDHPQKKFYRARAHCNPLSHTAAFTYPRCPEEAPWGELFPIEGTATVRFVDVGCGFGGLTVSLAAAFPQKCVLAMEIRDKVLLALFV